MKITVTQEHIDHAAVSPLRKCPVELALMDATRLNVSVDFCILVWLSGNNHVEKYEYEAETSQDITDKILVFRDHKTMDPFEFEIDYELDRVRTWAW